MSWILRESTSLLKAFHIPLYSFPIPFELHVILCTPTYFDGISCSWINVLELLIKRYSKEVFFFPKIIVFHILVSLNRTFENISLCHACLGVVTHPFQGGGLTPNFVRIYITLEGLPYSTLFISYSFWTLCHLMHANIFWWNFMFMKKCFRVVDKKNF